jgi:hypothetical protein
LSFSSFTGSIQPIPKELDRGISISEGFDGLGERLIEVTFNLFVTRTCR